MNGGYGHFEGHHGPDHIAPMNPRGPEIDEDAVAAALADIEPIAPSHHPGIPRQWVVTLPSGEQALVRFVDDTETEIEVATRTSQWSTWSPGFPGVPA